MISFDESAFFGEVGGVGEGREGKENSNLQPHVLIETQFENL